MALLFAILISFCVKSVVATTNNTGFSLELVPNSIYNENLTDIEKFERLKISSEARANWLEMKIINNKSHEMALRPILVNHDKYQYFVKISVGIDRIQQYLFLGTGSDLTWIQCHPCSSCLPQNPPLYRPLDSKTYKNLDCDHPFCRSQDCKEGTCRYVKGYEDGSMVGGVLAKERFEGIDDFIFGCAYLTRGISFPNKHISGILGMDASQQSFTMQLSRYTQGRFSHCFIPNFASTTSYLRFGSDIVEKSYYQKTRIIRTNSNSYYLQLNDISVDKQHLNLPQGIFNLKPDNSGGCMMDSGAMLSYMVPEAYAIVETAFMKYFSRYSMTPVSRGGENTQLCYRTRGRLNLSPSMTLHFDGADLKLEPFNLFHNKGNNESCLIISTQKMTIIGVFMQQDIKFVYDLNTWELSFGREKCAGT